LTADGEGSYEGGKIMQRVADLLERHGLQPSNRAVIGDLSDLALSVRKLDEAVHGFVSLSEAPTDNEILQAALAGLAQQVTYMQMVCSDLEEPLDELVDPEAGIRAILGGVEDTMSSFSGPDQSNEEQPRDTFTPAAERFWEAMPAREQTLVINNVWCAGCRKSSTLVRYTGRIQDGHLVLEGECKRCGSEVARLVEETG